MIETNCYMPDEFYNDWLLEQGYIPDEGEFFIPFYDCAYLFDGYGKFGLPSDGSDSEMEFIFSNIEWRHHGSGYGYNDFVGIGNGYVFADGCGNGWAFL